MILTHIKRCDSGHRLSTFPEKRILEVALRCNLHKIGANLIEKDRDNQPNHTGSGTIQETCKRMVRISRKTEVDRSTCKV